METKTRKMLCIWVTTMTVTTIAALTPGSKVLVFGGNGFMGSAVAEKMLEKGYKLTLINRGNWYWDTERTIKPFVRHFKCDRGSYLHTCPGLQTFINNYEGLYFDAVVDFSAYHQQAVIEALRMFRGIIGRYIYISSDSVYEVCTKNHSFPSTETDAVRPFDQQTRMDHSRRDDYGHRKLEIEEVLEGQRANPDYSIPYISLRLPDVIGPRDNTYRWWMYQMWIKLTAYTERHLSVPVSMADQPLSLVYSLDVADLVVKLLDASLDVFDEAYNLAFTETPTLKEILESIKLYSNATDVKVNIYEGPAPFYLFPSVKLGPVDITKAVTRLNWTPTTFQVAAKLTTEFYEQASSFPNLFVELKEIIRLMQSHFTTKPLKIIQGLTEVYGIQINGHDEL